MFNHWLWQINFSGKTDWWIVNTVNYKFVGSRKESNKLFIDVFYDLRNIQILTRINQLNLLMSFY